MSWSFTAAGKGSEAAEKIKAQAEQSKQYSQGDRHAQAVDGVVAVSEAFAAAFPEKTVAIESSGHIDQTGGYGNASFSAKVYQ